MSTSKNHEIGATEFKAKCLELITEVHGRKREYVVITKRGKPFAKLVRIDESSAPFYGCMKGLAEVRGDITEPTGAAWEALAGRA
jgi:prevent-host-death family protein